MPLNVDYLRGHTFSPIDTVLTDRDMMLYALSIGLASDPLNETELVYAFEKTLQPFATMPLIIGHPGNWMIDPQTGITRTMVVHGSQRLWSFAPLPLGKTITSTNKITQLIDKGDKGAIMTIVRETIDKESGTLLSRGESGVFCRADGNFGGSDDVAYSFAATPDRAPDHSVDMPTQPNAALLYRLNQDRNPLHADPAIAKKAGFSQPILHGLATYGFAATAICRQFPGQQIKAIEARFSRPVLPGETITVDMWQADDHLAFRARIAARDVVVLDRGRVELTPS